MAVTFEQFIQGLEQSGIISPDNLRAVCAKLPHDRQHDAQELARELVRQKILTTYQVKEAYQGKAKDLVLGNYTILDTIGAGGMGQVFKAQHRKMKRLVAIKLLPAAMTKDQTAINRFQREVEAAAKLEHPNIVTAHDADEAAGRHFLVMQYVEGTDLSALVKKNGPLPVDQAVSCINQAARGLEYAHRRGVVHRDIKPANLLLDLEGTVKILDMGLARLESATGAEHAELTGTGQIMGTVDYMAPEQALNTKHADQRADIYSLGITLWYLLTGRAVFGGETVMEKLLAHREQPIPSLQAACPGSTLALESVFTKMVAKKAEGRYQSMSEVVAELERISLGQVTAPSVGDHRAEDHRRSEFSGSTNPSKAAGGHPPGKPVAVAKRPSSTVLEATITMAEGQVETDPKTEQSLVVPDTGPIGWKHWRASLGRRTSVLTACAAGAAALLLAGIVFYLEIRQGTVRIEIIDPGIEVVVDGKGATINTGWNDWPADAPKPAIAPFDSKQALAHQEAWAKHLGTQVEIENSLGMKLRLIPPGEFLMGSPQEEIDALVQTTTDQVGQRFFRGEGPRHRVKLTQAFYLGSCEVTQQQCEELMGVNPSHFSVTGQGTDAVKDLDTGQHPVENVTWFNAVDFCNKLSEKEKRFPYYARDGETVTVLGGSGYRLPTEAEWEYAGRAGTTTRWSFGDREQDLAKHAWFGFAAGSTTHRVGGLHANPFGLYDIYGNVMEWCWDCYGEYAAGLVSDPTGAETGLIRVYRGGGWGNVSAFCRTALRGNSQPAYRHTGLGLRLARTIDAKSDVSPTTTTGDSKTQPDDTGSVPVSAKPPDSAIAPFDANQALAHQEAWAKHLGTKVETEISLGMKLRLIPPGEFMMGSPPDEIDALVATTTDPKWQGWFRSEGPQHRVKLTQAFFLGSCEVTQQQYQAVMGINPSHFSPGGPGMAAVQGMETSLHPVELLNWFDAVDFCNKLSEKEQRSPYYLRDEDNVTVLGGTGYRLPTEAEWEYACRAGTSTRWSFGDNEQDLAQHVWVDANARNRTHRVGELLPNPFGLYDMHGNAWEWCWDLYGEHAAGPVCDPTGAKTGSGRVFRGGGWDYSSAFCWSAYRDSSQPSNRYNSLGFRLARTVDTKSEVFPSAAAGGSTAPAKDTDPVSASVKPPKSAIAPFDTKQTLAHQEAWAKHLGVKFEIENSLGMKLRLIPPGEFTMGSPQDEIDVLVQSTTEPGWHGWFRNEGPQHPVKLTQAFYLGSCEVTQRQYQEVMGANPSHFSRTGDGKEAVKNLDTSQFPVEMVSWFDAVDFCNKLGEKEQRPPYYMRDGEAVKVLGGTGYRLPTEAEWEYACRAGTTTLWSFGDTERDLGQHAWFDANSNHRTQRVGELPANPFGLDDLYGNVWEWCWDWHGEYTAGAASDPPGSAVGSERVRRGGAFFHDWPISRSALHFSGDPLGRNLDTGFRVARTIDAKGEVIPPDATSGSTTQASDTAPVAISVNPPPVAIAPFDAKQALAHQDAWAKHLGTKIEIENSLGMKLRLVPPGQSGKLLRPHQHVSLLGKCQRCAWP